MGVASASRTITTSPTSLVAVPDLSGGSLLVSNPPDATVTVYIGASDVTTTSGVPLVAGATLTADLGGAEQLYGIVAAGTQAVRVLSTGL